MTNLAGIHEPDQEAAPQWGDKPGTVVFAVAIGSNPNDRSGGDWRWWADRGFRVMVRLNNGWKPDGTIPAPSLYESFAQRCANYVAASRGCAEWIIGNEPNHEQERPQGQIITAPQYAACFSLCREAIKRVQPNARVIVAGPAPWNEQSGDWLDYWRTTLLAVQSHGTDDCGADGLALHAYTHGTDPALIDSAHREHGWLWHFRTFEDQLAVVPPYMRDLSVDITETNQGDDPWLDANSGWVQRAVRNVDEWNQMSDMHKIRSVCLYRWPRYDTKYSFADKKGVLEDFRQACALGLNAPKAEEPVQSQAEPRRTFMPSISTGGDNGATPELPPIEWDERLTARGVTVESPQVAPGQQFWRVVKARWYNEQEADAVGPDHHILVDVLDRAGRRVAAGSSLVVEWPNDHTLIYTEAKPGEKWAANYGMSKSLNEFTVSVNDGLAPSEKLKGVGMGMNGNSGVHTSTEAVFQLTTMPDTQIPSQPPVEPPQPSRVPMLAHPVADPRYRVVTQVFGVNGDYYKRFSVDGVPLRGHNGIDFGTPEGTPIVAVDDGLVVESANDPGGYGEYVKIRHAWGETLYAHLSLRIMRHLDAAQRGQYVGVSGDTGNSTGPHLHFGLRVTPFDRRDGWGGYTDPAAYLINVDAPSAPGPFLPSEPQATQETTHLPVRETYLPWFRQYGAEYGVEWHLLAALAYNESKYNAQAVSPKGALGLMQFMPGTWADMQTQLGVSDPFDPEQSIKAAAFYLVQIRTYLIRFKKYSLDWVLAGYNWGMGYSAQGSWEQVPPETKRWVDLIKETSEALRRWEEGW